MALPIFMDIKSEAPCLGENVDRFSKIPKDLVHEILSFLSIKDIARISAVSKRFRQLSLSVPNLFLDFEFLCNLCEVGKWTDQLFTLRNGAKLRRFVLSLYQQLEHEDTLRVCNWIQNAVACEAEELDLSIGVSRECFTIPPSSFLIEMKLDLHNCNLQLPSSSSGSFSSLQFLDIKRARLAQNLSDNWVSSLFPTIKNLTLEGITGINNLNITSSSLLCLHIYDCGIDTFFVSSETLRALSVEVCYCSSDRESDNWLFGIYAPSLESVFWSDHSYVFYASSMCLPSENIAPNKFWIVLLHLMKYAKSVALNAATFRHQEMFMRDSPWYMWDNVQNLDLQILRVMDPRLPELASFFGRLPNVKVLFMGCTEYNYACDDELRIMLLSETNDIDIECWESQYVAFLPQLKEAEIKIHQWGFGVGLVKYLIKHAKALEKMTVTFSDYIDMGREWSIRQQLSVFYEAFAHPALEFVFK